MPKPEEIKDPKLRRTMEEAHKAVRSRDFTTSIRLCADAYLELARRKPEVLDDPGARIGRGPMAWPRLGANFEPGANGEPTIQFNRERFTSSEAYTYYEFTMRMITSQGL